MLPTHNHGLSVISWGFLIQNNAKPISSTSDTESNGPTSSAPPPLGSPSAALPVHTDTFNRGYWSPHTRTRPLRVTPPRQLPVHSEIYYRRFWYPDAQKRPRELIPEDSKHSKPTHRKPSQLTASPPLRSPFRRLKLLKYLVWACLVHFFGKTEGLQALGCTKQPKKRIFRNFCPILTPAVGVCRRLSAAAGTPGCAGRQLSASVGTPSHQVWTWSASVGNMGHGVKGLRGLPACACWAAQSQPTHTPLYRQMCHQL